MNPSTAIAQVLVDELIACGVTEAVLSPGSRNAPLSMALHAADAAGRIRLHVRIDERTAGFLALGLAKTSERPVPVVTTSGTAVANLHPAVVEADLSGVPLLVLSADRPPQLRDVGANQVIDQVRLFGNALRFFHEFETPAQIPGQNARWRSMVCRSIAYATGAAGAPGPVQLNLSLAEPLMPDSSLQAWPESLQGVGSAWTVIDLPGTQSAGIDMPDDDEKCLFVADFAHPLAAVVAAAGYLVISEAGGAAGTQVLAAGMHLLADAAFMAEHRPDRVIVLGRPTLYRQVTVLLTNPAVTVDVVAEPVGWRGIAGNARRVSATLQPLGEGDTGSKWQLAWSRANMLALDALTKVLDASPISASPRLARELVSLLPLGSNLIVGSSQPVRDVGLAAGSRATLQLSANRGAAGIDGTNSTAIGTALAAAGPSFAYVGDVTFLHDLTGLVIGPAEPRPNLTIVVSNNDGGGIFSTLESGDAAHAAAFERVFGTPHRVSLAGVVAGLGASYARVETPAELARAIGERGGIRVIEVRTTRDDLRALNGQLKAAVAAALAGL
ncbi:2-succinyl-5-enolpyruvyl-6-hydroxy-3-cyclohexene-1-carboxylic-acid synthase [Nakamurella antarctica]|uniref:2-succinyl-5-enolpyruvyl-6-hydroxy-3-cyclohexene-1-carboxylate synthase n=1 Tax=Nakamurella antarctica TaxID=1902245 RepID=A0A3G8ZN59_9ACTN|nr:2-succinyl-5-enolpyruvyl-6-hydroxy-3-cyclohexene-1-carboxylic-acid synthase [Nakamurella antarctica]AZI58749.1 2-succinyl-5-enolpyruvyl-6-hydroxy-3-cyclohexene-1-carboxylic-acid synthase [Nakamurella antarctica]